MGQEGALKYLEKQREEQSIEEVANALKVSKTSARSSLMKLFHQKEAILIIKNVKIRGGLKKTFFFKKR